MALKRFCMAFFMPTPAASDTCFVLGLRQGFYAVYDTVFEKIVQQEVRSAERQDKAAALETARDFPRFGEEPCMRAFTSPPFIQALDI